MATYKVIKQGFRDGVMYYPAHPTRNKVITEKPIEPVPSWLIAEDEKVLTPAQKAAATKARNKIEKDKADEVAKNNEEIKGASFLAATASVETL